MRIQEWTDWATNRSKQTYQGPFCGIAIGPRSEEAEILVGGGGGPDALLQAGRVLPLKTQGTYTLHRTRGLIQPRTDISQANAAHNLTSTNVLQVMLFESAAELGAYTSIARPNGRYELRNQAVAVAWPTTTRVLTVPFMGRRQLAIYVEGADAPNPATFAQTGGMKAFGRRWMSRGLRSDNSAGQFVLERPIAFVPSTPGSNETTASNYGLAYYLGGMDNAENWDEIAIELATSDGTSRLYHVDVDCIGEIGIS